MSNMYVNKVYNLLWQYKLSEPMLLHVDLLFASYHLYAVTHSITAVSDSLHHRGELMRYINGSLKDPKLRVSDKTIGALCFLILFEVSYNYSFSPMALC